MARPIKDRTGMRYGRLLVLEQGASLPDGRVTWKCQCDCGNIKEISAAHLGDGNSRSCGCLIKDSRVGTIVDRVGQRFGRLVVLRLGEGRTAGGGVRWVCRCDCGNEKEVHGGAMVSGNVQSCGCLHPDAVHRTHGMSGAKEYRAWAAMKNRCYRPTDARYADYGGRGITVCDEWRASFEAFYRDMGPRPEGKSLDRIDVDGNYEFSNCRWATKSEQQLNKRARVTREQLWKAEREIERLKAIIAETSSTG